MTNLIIGCGYLGRRVAELWLDAGQSVAAVTRSQMRAEELKRHGIQSVVADITRPATLDKLPEAQAVLFAVGYDITSGLSRREYFIHGLQAVIEALSPNVQRFILISSTSVYGQTDGQLVDEHSPCMPISENGSVCLETENVLTNSRFGPCAVILRLAGIYGPGRLHRRAKDLLAGIPITVPKDNFLNLIHVDDASAILAAAAIHAKPPCTFIVADGHAVKYLDYIAYLAKLLGVSDPQFIEPTACESDQVRALSNKRLSSSQILSELGVQLKYPTYQKGLKAVFVSK
jgi:nucleoside-diphosphate-sugar epimerase